MNNGIYLMEGCDNSGSFKVVIEVISEDSFIERKFIAATGLYKGSTCYTHNTLSISGIQKQWTEIFFTKLGDLGKILYD